MNRMIVWLEHAANWFGRKTVPAIFRASPLLQDHTKEQEPVGK
ncbi:hypothetical protein [Metabacillus sp. 84]